MMDIYLGCGHGTLLWFQAPPNALLRFVRHQYSITDFARWCSRFLADLPSSSALHLPEKWSPNISELYLQQWSRWIHIRILDCLNAVSLRSPLLYILPRPLSARCRETLGPIPRWGGFAQVQVQAQIAVAKIHTWLAAREPHSVARLPNPSGCGN